MVRLVGKITSLFYLGKHVTLLINIKYCFYKEKIELNSSIEYQFGAIKVEVGQPLIN